MDIMTSHTEEHPSIAEICASVKRLGYSANQTIRLYGEEFEVISDPFPETGGIAIGVKTKRSSAIRVVQLPATILQSVGGTLPSRAFAPSQLQQLVPQNLCGGSKRF